MTAVHPSDADSRSSLFATLRPEVLEHVTRQMVRTVCTPEGVATLLGESRRLLLGATTVYDNLAAAVLRAFQTAEATLRCRLGNPPRTPSLGALLNYERSNPVLDGYAREWYTEFVRRFRNELSHPTQAVAFTPAIAVDIVESVHRVVAELFPDA